MEVHPIQSFKAMPAPKKAAVVAGTVAAAAAVATGAAYLKGKGSVNAELAGLKKIGGAVKEGYKAFFGFVKDIPAKVKAMLPKAKAAAEEATEKLEEQA